ASRTELRTAPKVVKVSYVCQAFIFVRAEIGRGFDLLRIPSFAAIVLQGVFGSIPWNAMGFLTMYLLQCGHTSQAAAAVASSVLVGKAVGGFLGGVAGDAIAVRCPRHGRPCLAQVSVLGGIPFVIALVLSAPHLAAPKL
ncbi:unnamed protein product, partial [Polarella glacialis]